MRCGPRRLFYRYLKFVSANKKGDWLAGYDAVQNPENRPTERTVGIFAWHEIFKVKFVDSFNEEEIHGFYNLLED